MEVLRGCRRVHHAHVDIDVLSIDKRIIRQLKGFSSGSRFSERVGHSLEAYVRFSLKNAQVLHHRVREEAA